MKLDFDTFTNYQIYVRGIIYFIPTKSFSQVKTIIIGKELLFSSKLYNIHISNSMLITTYILKMQQVKIKNLVSSVKNQKPYTGRFCFMDELAGKW